MEEAKQKLRNRAEASRRRRNNAQSYGSVSDISSASISNDEPSAIMSSLKLLDVDDDEDDEDISSLDDKSIVKLDDDIEELMSEESVRRRKVPTFVEVARDKDDESAC